MNKTAKIEYFDCEGRENLPKVIRAIRSYFKSAQSQGLEAPSKLVFLTSQGEGPALAYRALGSFGVQIIAVTFPPHFEVRFSDAARLVPDIPNRIKAFFDGVGIPVLRGRLPLDNMHGADAHNRNMATIKSVLSLFGRSVPLAVQSVLQACDFGLVEPGEQVLAATGDCALLITASTTQDFLRQYGGMAINEIICKPRVLSGGHVHLATEPKKDTHRQIEE